MMLSVEVHVSTFFKIFFNIRSLLLSSLQPNTYCLALHYYTPMEHKFIDLSGRTYRTTLLKPQGLCPLRTYSIVSLYHQIVFLITMTVGQRIFTSTIYTCDLKGPMIGTYDRYISYIPIRNCAILMIAHSKKH